MKDNPAQSGREGSGDSLLTVAEMAACLQIFREEPKSTGNELTDEETLDALASREHVRGAVNQRRWRRKAKVVRL
jgi:hypothetical protein